MSFRPAWAIVRPYLPNTTTSKRSPTQKVRQLAMGKALNSALMQKAGEQWVGGSEGNAFSSLPRAPRKVASPLGVFNWQVSSAEIHLKGTKYHFIRAMMTSLITCFQDSVLKLATFVLWRASAGCPSANSSVTLPYLIGQKSENLTVFPNLFQATV